MIYNSENSDVKNSETSSTASSDRDSNFSENISVKESKKRILRRPKFSASNDLDKTSWSLNRALLQTDIVLNKRKRIAYQHPIKAEHKDTLPTTSNRQIMTPNGNIVTSNMPKRHISMMYIPATYNYNNDVAYTPPHAKIQREVKIYRREAQAINKKIKQLQIELKEHNEQFYSIIVDWKKDSHELQRNTYSNFEETFNQVDSNISTLATDILKMKRELKSVINTQFSKVEDTLKVSLREFFNEEIKHKNNKTKDKTALSPSSSFDKQLSSSSFRRKNDPNYSALEYNNAMLSQVEKRLNTLQKKQEKSNLLIKKYLKYNIKKKKEKKGDQYQPKKMSLLTENNNKIIEKIVIDITEEMYSLRNDISKLRLTFKEVILDKVDNKENLYNELERATQSSNGDRFSISEDNFTDIDNIENYYKDENEECEIIEVNSNAIYHCYYNDKIISNNKNQNNTQNNNVNQQSTVPFICNLILAINLIVVIIYFICNILQYNIV